MTGGLLRLLYYAVHDMTMEEVISKGRACLDDYFQHKTFIKWGR